MNTKLETALDLHRKGNINEAHAIYSELLQNEEPCPTVIYLIGLVAIELKIYAEAVNFISHSIQLDSSETCYFLGLAYSAHKLGWFDQAEQAYQKAIVGDPRDARAFSNLGKRLRLPAGALAVLGHPAGRAAARRRCGCHRPSG